jgi:tetratricopeptide (TPR) repeat protein
VPLYDNLGNLHHEITVRVPNSQAYFNQGLRLLYAFNHAESARAFREAERLDPSCAMCPWGIALALGPNINAAMDSAAGVEAYAAIQRALERSKNAAPSERAYIQAMAKRFVGDPMAERAPLDSAYAQAMAEVADAYGDDVDAQVLYADALMNLSPWNYWEADGSPRPGTREIVSRLLYGVEKNPDHPGACHLYIHAEEAHDPTMAIDCAERLAELMPGAGHLVHMPGHIYIRVGRYADAIEQNRHAVHADESYLEGPRVGKRGIYPQGYYPHNYHFMSFAASMAGNGETAIYAARRVAEKLGPEVTREIGWLEAVTPIVYWTLVTFGKWDEILAEPLPPSDRKFMLGQAYYARGVAYAARRRWVEAEEAMDSVTAIARGFPDGDNRIALEIAREVLAGELAMRRNDTDVAVDHFRSAVNLEDALTYNEPPTWYYPVRQSLGKALMAAGRAAEAERVYREDLDRFPENGWSLYGLHRSLLAQGRSKEAEAIEQRFTDAWRHADVELSASRF